MIENVAGAFQVLAAWKARADERENSQNETDRDIASGKDVNEPQYSTAGTNE